MRVQQPMIFQLQPTAAKHLTLAHKQQTSAGWHGSQMALDSTSWTQALTLSTNTV